MKQFKDGDKVSHLSNINNGLSILVTAVDGDKVRCEWFEGPEQIHKQEWFSASELTMSQPLDGGFRKEGE